MLLRIHGVAAEQPQLRHRLGSAAVGVNEMLRCAKEFGLKARVSTTKLGTRFPARHYLELRRCGMAGSSSSAKSPMTKCSFNTRLRPGLRR